jgi:general nucleoside transport system permease protein
VTTVSTAPAGSGRSLQLQRRFRALTVPVLGAVIGLLIGAVLILIAGANPLTVYQAMIVGALGGPRQLTETVLLAAPILLMGLGLTVAFRARVWNIGAEGQYYIGALAGGLVALFFPSWPRLLLLTAMLIAGVVGGLLWALIAGWLKTYRGMNEIISTLMLNYVAILFVQYLVRGPLEEPGGYLPQSAQFVAAARLPLLFGSRIHLGVILALLVIPVAYLLLWHTPLGFRLRAVGSRASVARYAGISVNRMILFTMAFSGALAGLAGIIQISATGFRVKSDISVGYGFSAVLVALLGRMHPVGVLIAALFFAGLTTGAEAMHVVSKLPVALASAIQAVVVLSVIVTDAIDEWGQH